MSDIVGLEKKQSSCDKYVLKKRSVEKYSFFELRLVKMLKSYQLTVSNLLHLRYMIR